MTRSRLKNKQVILKLSDPWDLGEVLSWKPLDASVTAVKLDERNTPISIVIQLASPFDYKNTHCEYFVASPRHEGTDFSQLQKNQAVFSGLTRIPPDQVHSKDPFDLSQWRGGVGLIGDIELTY